MKFMFLDPSNFSDNNHHSHLQFLYCARYFVIGYIMCTLLTSEFKGTHHYPVFILKIMNP